MYGLLITEAKSKHKIKTSTTTTTTSTPTTHAQHTMRSSRAPLEEYINLIDDSCRQIQAHEFQSPGIFTNAIISQPSITKLLKDATEPEQSLYKISKASSGGFTSTTAVSNLKRIYRNNKHEGGDELDGHLDTVELKPERVDGKSIYVDNSFNEYSNHGDGQIRRAVKIPEIIKESFEYANRTDEVSSPTKRPQQSTTQHNLIPESVVQSENPNLICNALMQLVMKYPTLVNHQGLYNDINGYQEQYNTLLQEIEELETIVSEQRSQLNQYNVSMNEFSPVRSQEEESAIDIDELMKREKDEIEQLEKELNEKQSTV